MLYAWVKALVGAFLTVNFAAPLYAVANSRHLWEEPMAALAGNMSFICMLLGINLLLIGAYDIVQLDVFSVCRALQYSSFGFGVSFKMAQVCMAVDQFVAVLYPLQHYSIMTRARRWLFAATWITWAAQPTFGVLAEAFGLVTHADSIHGLGNGTAVYPECRWESSLAMVYAIFVEVQMMLFSLVTAGLLTYTFTVGYRTKVRLTRRSPGVVREDAIPQEDGKFFQNFKDFKKIIWIFSLTVPLDIVAPALRLSSRWYPLPKLNGLLHQLRLFGFTFEGWAYGLLNLKLRAAYRKILCGKCTSDMVEPITVADQHIHVIALPEIQT